MKQNAFKIPLRKSVQSGWFLSYLLVLLVPLVLCLILYRYSSEVITNESKRIYGSALEQARIDLESYMSEIQQTLSRTMQDQTIQKILATKPPMTPSDQLVLVEAKNAMVNIQTGHQNIYSVWVTLNKFNSIISAQGYLDQHLFYLSRFKNSSITEEAWNEMIHTRRPRWEMVPIEIEDRAYFLFMRSTLTNGLEYADATAVVMVEKNLFVQRLQQFCWDPELNFYVMQSDGTVICATDGAQAPDREIVEAAEKGSFAYDRRTQKAYLACRSNSSDWQYVLSISNRLLMKNTRTTQVFTWVGMVLCMALGLGLSAWLTRKSYRPLGQLVSSMDAVAEEPLDEKNEFERIAYYSQKNQRERTHEQHELWKSQQTLRRYYLKFMLENPLASSYRANDRYGLHFDKRFYMVVVFKNPLALKPDGTLSADVSYFEILQIATLNIFQEIAEKHFALELTDMGETCVAIVGMEENTEQQENQLLEDIRETERQVREHFKVELGAAVGDIHSGESGIRTSYQEALEALVYLQNDSGPVIYRGIHDARRAYTFPLETERKLVDLIVLGSEENAAELIRQAFPLDHIIQDPNVARCLSYDITAALIKGAALAGLEDQKDIRFSPGDASSPEELQAHLIEIAGTLCGRVRLLKGSTSSTRALCDKVQQYIRENYGDPDLNISQVGQHFDLTPTYLSAQFKKETGGTMLSFISRVRIDAAKQLLHQGLPVAKIAERVGYRDSGSLIRVFKKVTGMTPGQYRTSHNTEETAEHR